MGENSDRRAQANRGLLVGYLEHQWHPWKSHGLLLKQSVRELNWMDTARACIFLFRKYSSTRDGAKYMTKPQLVQLLNVVSNASPPVKQFPAHPQGLTPTERAEVFFDLFDRNHDGEINESDFTCGILAISPSTPHKCDGACGQLRMQFTFLYYDKNRSGKLGLEECRKLCQDLVSVKAEGQVEEELRKLEQLSNENDGPLSITFAQLYQAVHRRVLNGTSHLLRHHVDLPSLMKLFTANSDPPPEISQNPSDDSRARNKCDEPERPQKSLYNKIMHGRPLVLQHTTQGGLNKNGYQLETVSQNISGHVPLEEKVLCKVMSMSHSIAEWSGLSTCENLHLATGKEALELCDMVVEYFRREDSLVNVKLPTRVYGDIHGQLPDLLQLFNNFSWPDKRRGDILTMNYVFLGDFVDRGAYSVDVMVLLFSLKLLYPKRIFLIRGNHEDRFMNLNYGFYQDCRSKFGDSVGEVLWDRMNDVFEFLPIAALIENEVLCIHGGIGDTIKTLDDLRNIPKPITVVSDVTPTTKRVERIVLDALWSDPTDNDQVLGVQRSLRGQNTCRFGPDKVHEFTERNNLKLIIRGHECVKSGYEYFASGKLLTVFSATNYCNQYDNDGALIVLLKDEERGCIVEHAQVIKSGSVDTSGGWNQQQYREPSPIRATAARAEDLNPSPDSMLDSL